MPASTPSARTVRRAAVGPVELGRSRPVVDLAVASSRRRRSSPPRSASTRASSRSRNASQQRARGRPAGRATPRAGRSSSPASSGGKSAAAQSALIPMPTTTRGSSVPRPSVSPRTPAELADAGRRRRRLDDEVVRPLQADRRRRAGRRPPRPRRPSRATRPRREPPGPVGRRARSGRNPSESSSAAPGGATHVRPSRPRPAVCSSATARQTSGVPVGQPAADDVVRRADDGEALASGPGTASRATSTAQPAAATSTGSGRSSSKAAWSARSAVSSSSSAMMQVIRISEVEIISMLTPASASVPNIRAA